MFPIQVIHGVAEAIELHIAWNCLEMYIAIRDLLLQGILQHRIPAAVQHSHGHGLPIVGLLFNDACLGEAEERPSESREITIDGHLVHNHPDLVESKSAKQVMERPTATLHDANDAETPTAQVPSPIPAQSTTLAHQCLAPV